MSSAVALLPAALCLSQEGCPVSTSWMMDIGKPCPSDCGVFMWCAYLCISPGCVNHLKSFQGFSRNAEAFHIVTFHISVSKIIMKLENYYHLEFFSFFVHVGDWTQCLVLSIPQSYTFNPHLDFCVCVRHWGLDPEPSHQGWAWACHSYR